MLTAVATEELAKLYQSDETAWLDSMADLIGRGDVSELDYDNLREYLTDMANRDRKEVMSRLIVLIAHHLKWRFQEDKRTMSWRMTIAEQRRILAKDFETKTLQNYGERALAEAYAAAVEQAAIETGKTESEFPATSQHTAREWVALPVPK